jgi:antitoxin component of MazEF toxin-antitoxin module
MVVQKLRRVGNSVVVTIPKEEIERQKLEVGQLVAVSVQPVEVRPVMSDALREVFEESWQRNEAGYRYLKDR